MTWIYHFPLVDFSASEYRESKQILGFEDFQFSKLQIAGLVLALLPIPLLLRVPYTVCYRRQNVATAVTHFLNMPCRCRRKKCWRPVDIDRTTLKVDKGDKNNSPITIDQEIKVAKLYRKAGFDVKYQVKGDYIMLDEYVGVREAIRKVKAKAWFLKMLNVVKKAKETAEKVYKELLEEQKYFKEVWLSPENPKTSGNEARIV